MKKCNIKYFKYYNHEIYFRSGVNYIFGSNGSGKSTLLLIIQHSLGLLSIPTPLILETTTEIELIINNNIYRFIRESGSNEIHIENNSITAMKFNINSEEYNEFLVGLFEPDMELTENSQIKTLISDMFYSSDSRSKITQSHLAYLMLGVDKKYEDNIKKKINMLSERMREKEKTVQIINQYKNDVLEAIGYEIDFKIHDVMNDVYEKYKREQLSDCEIIEKSEYILDRLKEENKIKIEKTLEYLDFLSLKYQINYRDNSRRNISDILLNKNNYLSGSERTFNEIISKILIQSGYSCTNGIGVLFNDHASHIISNDIKDKIREVAEIASSQDDLQYIELVSSADNIEKEKIIYNLDNLWKDEIIQNRDIWHG